MFVASRVYNYATGTSASSTSHRDATPADSRVKRHPRKKPHRSSQDGPPSYASVAGRPSRPSNITLDLDEPSRAFVSAKARSTAELAQIAIIDDIVRKEDLYEILGVKRNAKTEDIRRGFLNRSRVCHPDKLPKYAPCVVAFQKVSLAYQTLSKPSSRRLYDASGRSDLAAALNDAGSSSPGTYDAGSVANDETLNSVLYSVFCEFLEGDFEMIRVLINALNEGQPGLSLGDDAVDSIEGAFRRLRDLMLAGKKYLTIIRFELIRLYEIQHSLRQLSYFDVFGRLRLTLQLARVTLSIPMAIDQAMKEPDQEQKADDDVDAFEYESTGDKEYEDDSEVDELTESEARVQNPRARRKKSMDDFGMRAEEEEDADGLDNRTSSSIFDVSGDQDVGNINASRAARRQARLEERRRARLEAREAHMIQKRGLLGPTAAGLLKGVVKVLEASESWVPGAKAREDNAEYDRVEKNHL